MIHAYVVFFVGLIVGSFLNVCIYRMPRNISVIGPRSKCPACSKMIAWYDNIPLLSYLLLRGRCRYCSQKISFRYFLVEFLTALLYVFLFLEYSFSIKFFVYSLLFSGLIVASFIDFEFQIIPDEISLGMIVLGVLINGLMPGMHDLSGYVNALIFSGLGVLAGGASLYLTGILGDILFKKESMGGGDIKLLAGIGAFLGWKIALLTFFIAPLFGAFAGIMVKIRTKESIIPYGPFISLGAFVALVWGEQILSWIMPL